MGGSTRGQRRRAALTAAGRANGGGAAGLGGGARGWGRSGAGDAGEGARGGGGSPAWGAAGSHAAGRRGGAGVAQGRGRAVVGSHWHGRGGEPRGRAGRCSGAGTRGGGGSPAWAHQGAARPGGAAGLGVLWGRGCAVAGSHRRGPRRGATRLSWGVLGGGGARWRGLPAWAHRGAARPGGAAGLGVLGGRVAAVAGSHRRGRAGEPRDRAGECSGAGARGGGGSPAWARRCGGGGAGRPGCATGVGIEQSGRIGFWGWGDFGPAVF
ncbi:uncharacterized protein [Miscanthus floridulus]|uniref:uncharacterized protein n=1 Tax=Miscanthus floridulus TaxID=154761 RepID=UPI00345B1C7D